MNDEMKIQSKFMTSIISKAIEHAVSKKLGRKMNIQLNCANAAFDEDKLKIHVDADIQINKEEFKALVAKFLNI